MDGEKKERGKGKKGEECIEEAHNGRKAGEEQRDKV